MAEPAPEQPPEQGAGVGAWGTGVSTFVPADAVVTAAHPASAAFVRTVVSWGAGNGTEQRATQAAQSTLEMEASPQMTFHAGTCISPAHSGPLTVGVVRPLGHGCFKSVFEAQVMDADGNLQPDGEGGRFGLAICRSADPLGLETREVCRSGVPPQLQCHDHCM